MRNVFLKFLFLIIVCFSVLPVEIYAKKEKKPYQWEMPKKLSGVKEMDEYLLACDTLWNKIQAYKDSITFFHLDTLKRMVNGQPCYVIKIVDEEGQERSFSQSIMQGIDIISNGSLIILDATNISLLTTLATLSIGKNPLIGFSHGKYLKAGPNIVKLAYEEVREIVNATKLQMRQTKAMRTSMQEGSTDQACIVGLSEKEREEADIENFIDIQEGELGNNDAEVDIPEGVFDNVDLEDIPEDPNK